MSTAGYDLWCWIIQGLRRIRAFRRYCHWKFWEVTPGQCKGQISICAPQAPVLLAQPRPGEPGIHHHGMLTAPRRHQLQGVEIKGATKLKEPAMASQVPRNQLWAVPAEPCAQPVPAAAFWRQVYRWVLGESCAGTDTQRDRWAPALCTGYGNHPLLFAEARDLWQYIQMWLKIARNSTLIPC